MRNHIARVTFLLSSSLAVLGGCVQSMDDGAPPDPTVPAEPEASAPLTGDWDEARALDAAPCGAAIVASCEAETRGACGVVAAPEGDECLPLFNWGVRPDGRIEFGSTARLFTLADLARTPLSTTERDEADAMRELIASAAFSLGGGEGLADESEHELEPLAAINHSSSACYPYTTCSAPGTLRSFSTYLRFVGHYNAWREGVYRHIHIVNQYVNASSPWYYCNAIGSFMIGTESWCGTP